MAVIGGVTRVEMLAHVMVDGAVRQVLGEVAQTYGTTLEALMRAHGDRAVAMWTRTDPEQPSRRKRPLETLCAATTRSKKPCSKPATVGTLCSWHAAQKQAREHAQDNKENEAQRDEREREARVAAFQARLREMPPPPPPRMSQSQWTFSQELSQLH